MSYPKIYRDLFQNDGAGGKLREDVIPDTVVKTSGLTAVTNGLIPKSGNAGTLTTSEAIATASTVNDKSARSMNLASGGSLTVANGSANMAWITVVALNGSATITLGSAWAWSGSSPTLAKGLVTLAWYGTFGVANFQKFGE